jgi:hypothetical protein
VDWATEDCFLEDLQTREDPRKYHVPEVLFRSIPQPTKSTSKKLIRLSEEEAEYQTPNSGVCLRYLKIRWTTVRCEEREQGWKRAHKHTTNWMSVRVTVRYRRKPIMLLYSLWSTSSPFHVDLALSPCSLVLTRAWSQSCWTSSSDPSCIWLDVQRYLDLFTWLEYLGNWLALPSWTSGTHSISFPKS